MLDAARRRHPWVGFGVCRGRDGGKRKMNRLLRDGLLLVFMWVLVRHSVKRFKHTNLDLELAKLRAEKKKKASGA